MYCECCGSVMQWRSTNQVTGLSKFKCLDCGNVQLGRLEVKCEIEDKRPKFYSEKDGRWIVKRKINHEERYIASLPSEEIAQKVVEELDKVDWDKSYVPHIFDKLGIHKVKRSWVVA